MLCLVGIGEELVQIASGIAPVKRPDPGAVLLVAIGIVFCVMLYAFDRDAFLGRARERRRVFAEFAIPAMIVCSSCPRALDRTPSPALVGVAIVALAGYGWIIVTMFRLRREMKVVG